MASPTNPDVSQRIDRAVSEVRSWDAVAIVGAGLSRGPGFPTTSGLTPLVWQALDADLPGRAELAAELEMADTNAQALLDDDALRVTAGLTVVARRPRAREVFQRAFARLDDDRGFEQSAGHEALAELVHRGKVSHVVSLNWDTLLERAHQQLYGRPLLPAVDRFAKPHGDAHRPEEPWVLPHEPGGLPDELAAALRALADERPRVLLIIGYSERDEGIVRQLIGPLGERWRVIRIGPSAINELDLPLSAAEALPLLVEGLDLGDELPGWEYVSFEPQRGIGPAVLGEGLGPHEVDDCPELPEVDAIQRLLPLAGVVTIAGASGSGKSISAYQAARHQEPPGWEVIRLTLPRLPDAGVIGSLSRLRHPTIAIVDDAQTLPVELVRGIRDAASPASLRIIVASTDASMAGTVVRVAAQRGVRELAAWFGAHQAEILPLIRQLDDRVGDDWGDVSFETRVAEAAREETPWQFGFVLRGGWREARSAIAPLRDADRADLCLAALSIAQLATADGGVTFSSLERIAQPLGRTREWLEASLSELRAAHRVGHGQALRTPHARFARVALEVVLEDPADPERARILEMIRASLRGDSDIASLQGTFWLIEALTFAEGVRWELDRLADAGLVDNLVSRLRAAPPGRDRGAAAAGLDRLRRWNPRVPEILQAEPGWISQWLAEAQADECYGLASLLNDFINDDRPFAARLCETVPIAPILSRALAAEPNELYGWGEFLGRLSVAASPTKRAEVGALLDETALLALVTRSLTTSPGGASRFLQAISSFDRTLALRVIDSHASLFAARMNRSPVDGFWETEDVLWWVLGFAPRWLTRRGPDALGRRIARRIAALIDPRRVAAAIETAPPRDWQGLSGTTFFMAHAIPESYQAVLDAIDVDRLDEATAMRWSATPHPLDELLNLVGWGENNEPARTLIERHEHELGPLTPRIAMIAPASIVRRLNAGDGLSLSVKSGRGWDFAAGALDAIYRVDEEAANRLLAQNADEIATGLAALHSDEGTAAGVFLAAMRQADSEFFASVVSSLEVDPTFQAWAKQYRNQPDRAGVRALVEMVADEPGAGSEIADRMRARFPSLTRSSPTVLAVAHRTDTARRPRRT